MTLDPEKPLLQLDPELVVAAVDVYLLVELRSNQTVRPARGFPPRGPYEL